MNLNEAETLAVGLMEEFELWGWLFKFDKAKKRFGWCRLHKETIQLSAPLTLANERAAVEDVIRHEIAHALAGPVGHGPEWVKMCAYTGAKPERCVNLDTLNAAAAPWYLVCAACDYRAPMYRRPTATYDHRPCGSIMLLERG